MALLNYFLHLNAYSDAKASNSPNLTNFKWVRDIQGIPAVNPVSQVITIPAGESVTLFENAEKKFIYVESLSEIQVELNSSQVNTLVKPVVVGASKFPGQFLINSEITDALITNPDTDNDIQVFVAYHE